MSATPVLALRGVSKRFGAVQALTDVELEVHAEERLGVLTVRAFADPASGPKFPELLEQSFLTLHESGIAHLVLDLRGNGGGRDQYGALLVSYLCDRPFGYFERIEVTPDYQGSFEIVEKDGPNAITRAAVLDGLKNLKDFDANGWAGKKTLRGASDCWLLMQIKDAKFERVYPTERGTLSCDPENVITVNIDPEAEAAKIN